MKKITIFLVCILSMLNVAAQDVNYDVSNIPEALLKDADAVVRNDQTIVRISNSEVVVSNIEMAITILNENGKERGYIYLPYNKYRRYSKLSVKILDKYGEKVKKIKLDEIHDQSMISSASLYDDQRIIVCEPNQNDYPYTVHYTYEMTDRGMLFFPSLYSVGHYNVSSQKMGYRVLAPKGMELRTKGLNISEEPDRSDFEKNEDSDSYYWEAENVLAIKSEPYSKSIRDFAPHLKVSPLEFNYGGVSGSFETWNSFGHWIWSFLPGKEVFEEETAAEIEGLVKDCSSDRDKVKVLYKYMQDKVRYVNISIGIGGFEPIAAQRVHDVGYGDCKALSFYMKAMLKRVGIESVYTVVKAGRTASAIDLDYPSQQFNHVILMVPMEEDSIWLECTDQRYPAGYLGSFTEDRTVLFVTEDGGKIGHTPAFSKEDNLVSTKVEVELNEELDAQIIRDRLYRGVNFGGIYSGYLNRDDEEMKKSIQASLSLSGFILKSYDYQYKLDDDPYISQHIEVEDDHVVSISGTYIMLPLNLVTTNISSLDRVRSRKQEVLYRSNRSFSDSVYISIPEGYSIYEMPEQTEINTEFGVYRSSVEKTEKGVLYCRYYEVYKGVYPASSYRDFYQFFKDMSKASSQKLMLTKG